MSSALNTLLEMGFPQNRAEKAIMITGNNGPEEAMEWLLAHCDDPDIDEPVSVITPRVAEETPTLCLNTTVQPEIQSGSALETETSHGDNAQSNAQAESESDAVARSLKCDECGKLFKSEAEVEFHAAKSGHQSFSESTEELKPLSEEERREQLRKLEEKIKFRRLEKEAQEKREQIEREKERRRVGQEITEAKKKLEEEDMRRIAEQRRKEKMEEKMARQRVLEQIERDKQARKEKFGGGTPSDESQSSSRSSSTTSINSNSTPRKSYDQTRLQIRLPSGEALTQTFGTKEELAAVRLYIQMKQTDNTSKFNMMTNFPKRVFTEEDMEKPLCELGLVPSAVIIVTKI